MSLRDVMFGWMKGRDAEVRAVARPFGHLRPGQCYHVVQTFVDHDRIVHPIGEAWTFQRSDFLPYDDGLSLFVATPDGSERQIRLQWRPEAEGHVIDSLPAYVQPTSDDATRWLIRLSRDSVCMGDDIDAPHVFTLSIARGADAAAVARAILADRYLAWVGSTATWSLTIGLDRVLLGYRSGSPFVRPIGRKSLTARAEDVDDLHVTYLAQADPMQFEA